jgi:hypothetical protein
MDQGLSRGAINALLAASQCEKPPRLPLRALKMKLSMVQFSVRSDQPTQFH